MNSFSLKHWIADNAANDIEFRWVPSHLGFRVNELANAAADSPPHGPFPTPVHTSASWLRLNKGKVIVEWRLKWASFTANKRLILKSKKGSKKRILLPDPWDAKGKKFMSMAGNITTFSCFTWLISGHAPTGEYCQHFFPQEPRECTCFAWDQTHQHLLTECPKYISCFSSLMAFYTADNNTAAILKYLKNNPTAYMFEDEPIDVYEPPWLPHCLSSHFLTLRSHFTYYILFSFEKHLPSTTALVVVIVLTCVLCTPLLWIHLFLFKKKIKKILFM